MANPHGTPIWYELQTPDPDAATTFYDAVMGWTIEDRPAGEMDYRMIGAAGGHAGGVARWDAAMPGAAAAPGWLMYIGVDDVDASVATLVAAGGTVSIPAFDFPGVGRIAKVADPQGVAFYLMRAAAEDDSDVFSATAIGRVSWNELTTSDLAAATGFYDALCGWQVTGSMPMGGDLGDYCFLSLGTTPIGAAMTRPANGLPPTWRFYVRVADIEAAATAIEARGGTIHHGPVEVPGGDHIVVASDPHGSGFGAVGPRSAAA